MNVTLKQLRAFAAVAREGSFTRASERLHVTQSTLTSSIKILEAEVGLRLLDRSTRSVVLTPQGSSFLPTCERILRDLSESLEQLRLTANRQSGSVVAAAAASFISYVMSPAVARMAIQYPGISVRLLEEPTEGVARLVLAGEADFGVTTLFQPVPDLEATLLLTDLYGAVYRAPHPIDQLAERLRWNQLERHTMIGVHRSNGIRALIDLHPGIAAHYKRPRYEAGSVPSLQPLLLRGLGYAALPALAARPLIESGLSFKPLTKPALRRRLYLVKRKGRTLSPSAIALMETMTDALTQVERDKNLEVVFDASDILRFRGA